MISELLPFLKMNKLLLIEHLFWAQALWRVIHLCSRFANEVLARVLQNMAATWALSLLSALEEMIS